MRESKVESHLRKQVLLAGGTTRKWVSPGHPGVPDQIVIWPTGFSHTPDRHRDPNPAVIHFVECKAPGKKARPGQAREHVRLQKLGCVVLVLDTIEKVDNYVARNK